MTEDQREKKGADRDYSAAGEPPIHPIPEQQSSINWASYPRVRANPFMRDWLSEQALQKADTTIANYARSLEHYLAFCIAENLNPLEVSSDAIFRYVFEMSDRPAASSGRSRQSGTVLAGATLEQRYHVVRLFYRYVDRRIDRPTLDLPVDIRIIFEMARAEHADIVSRQEALAPIGRQPPYIPSDQEWRAFLLQARRNALRDRVIILLTYEGALRRDELLAIDVADLGDLGRRIVIPLDPPELSLVDSDRAIIVRKLHNWKRLDLHDLDRRVVLSILTAELLRQYLDQREQLLTDIGEVRDGTSLYTPGALFRSESNRSLGQPLSARGLNAIIRDIALRAAIDLGDNTRLASFSFDTIRMTRLTHLARARWSPMAVAMHVGRTSQTSSATLARQVSKQYGEILDLDLLQSWAIAVFKGMPEEPTLFTLWRS